MIILIGSQALNFYGRLKNRKPYDWDLLSPESGKSVKINGLLFDTISSEETTAPTNKSIYEYCVKNCTHFVNSPMGVLWVAPLEILKVLKLGSLPTDKEKHAWDLKELADIVLSDDLNELAIKRHTEAEDRVRSQKDQFFNKYNIPRFFNHDDLHLFVAEQPAYKKSLKEGHATEADEVKFNDLSLLNKKLVVWEECMVLSLERELIPQVRSAPMFIEKIVEDFQVVETSSDPAIKWLSRLSQVGKVKDHPDWLALWIKSNSDELFRGYGQWWEETVHSLPEEFWRDLYYKD